MTLGLDKDVERLAIKNYESMRNAGIKKLIVSCPSCLRAFTGDYPELIGEFDIEVYYISQLLSGLLRNGDIQLVTDEKMRKATYHHPTFPYRNTLGSSQPALAISSLHRAGIPKCRRYIHHRQAIVP